MTSTAPFPSDEKSDLSEAQMQLLRQQREEEPLAAEAAARKLHDHSRSMNFDVSRHLIDKAQTASRATKRIRIILEAASAWGQELAAVAACQRGFSACCSIPVPTTSAEARHLSSVSGHEMELPIGELSVRQYAQRPEQLRLDQTDDRAHSSACPSLKGHECSVYDVRPMVRRTHFSLADSALLCQVVPGQPVSVPFANATGLRVRALMMQSDEAFADIREFFADQKKRALCLKGRSSSFQA